MTTPDRDRMASFVTARLRDNGYDVPKSEVWHAIANWDALNRPLQSDRSAAGSAATAPTDEMVDAVARSFAGLSKRLWTEALEDSSSIMIATVKYYRDHARDALEAVGRLTITTPRVEIGGKDQS